MRYKMISLTIIMGFLLVTGFTYANPDAGAANSPLEQVKHIFKKSCICCHGGSNPEQELNLEPAQMNAYAVNVSSMEKMDHKIIDTSEPSRSYLLMKIKGDPAIAGKRMPLKKPPLGDEQVKAIEEWISGLKETYGETNEPMPRPAARPAANAFWGARLINLATPTVIPKGNFLFRVSHRFFFPAKDGYDSFYGLDGPAVVYLSLGYGITRNLDITFGRSNLYQELEMMLKWRILSPGGDSPFPLSAALHAGGNMVTQAYPGKSAWDSDRFKYTIQLSLAYPITPKISLLAVPGYTSNIEHFYADSEGTFALGTGLSVKLLPGLSLIGEWIPVLSGYQESTNGWGLGFEYKKGKHLFQVYIQNTLGITTDQFISGGDLYLRKTEFRFGFTIFREF
jgi:mono/diheme cytochrome c family protein